MSIPKKGSRKIVVENINYRWTIRKNATYSQSCFGTNLLVAVELFEVPSCTLSINFPNTRFDNLVKGNENSKIITPKLIEYCIKDAINKGWEPDKNGVTFKY
ncbi:MAG: hypothetical protein U0354_09235 [Candidatus Sericytochromatia bacterium]